MVAILFLLCALKRKWRENRITFFYKSLYESIYGFHLIITCRNFKWGYNRLLPWPLTISLSVSLFLSLCLSTGHIQACRALMILSLLLGLGCMIVSLLGLKCIKIGSATEPTKGKVAFGGGLMAILSGEFSQIVFLSTTFVQRPLPECLSHFISYLEVAIPAILLQNSILTNRLLL